MRCLSGHDPASIGCLWTRGPGNTDDFSDDPTRMAFYPWPIYATFQFDSRGRFISRTYPSRRARYPSGEIFFVSRPESSYMGRGGPSHRSRIGQDISELCISRKYRQNGGLCRRSMGILERAANHRQQPKNKRTPPAFLAVRFFKSADRSGIQSGNRPGERDSRHGSLVSDSWMALAEGSILCFQSSDFSG